MGIFFREMAGAGQPWYMPAAWPVAHVAAAVTKPKDDQAPKPSSTPIMGVYDIITACTAGLRNYIIACFLIYRIYDDKDPYPGFSDVARNYTADWILPIFARNLIGTLLICGFWDWFLYFSPLKEKLHKYKITSAYPSMHQIKHDVIVTLSASCCAAALEVFMCHEWAHGTKWLSFDRQMDPWALKSILIGASVTFWRIAHFHALHRGMHPWRTKRIPDVGKFLYRQVHALHHKSYNPTAFSGTNMHPVEATGYYTACFIPALWGNCHPVFALTAIIDCAIGAWLGHDGFQWPGSGDYFHMLHHRHFDCNYGALHVPLDWFFGTYAGSKEDVRKIWGKTESGEEANDTAVHPASTAKGKVE